MRLPEVSIVLPIDRAHGGLAHALCDLRRQTLSDIEILVVVNGPDASLVDRVTALGQGEPRLRVLHEPRRSLAAAVNLGLREARSPLVARMDDDDRCAPGRLERQALVLEADNSLAGVGCWWNLAGPDGTVTATHRPSDDPRRLRWRLRLANPFAHGSMMLRRDAVLAAGGYDESLDRAQDWELWLRLTESAPALGCVPEVHYTVQRSGGEEWSSSPEQAQAASAIMFDAISRLPSGPPPVDEVASLLGCASPRLGLQTLEDRLDEHPTREALWALLWANAVFDAPQHTAIEFCRKRRLREVIQRMASSGAESFWLWGAGPHSRWIEEQADELALPIAGVCCHAAPCQTEPAELPEGEHVLISSMHYEDDIWDASEPHRARGLRVWRLYAANTHEPADSADHGSTSRPLSIP